MAEPGRLIASHGRHYTVQMADGKLRQCYPRGKQTGPAVGDLVMVQPQGEDQGAIAAILPRRNLLYRSDAARSKQFAANIDQLLLVVAPEPEFSDELLGRALVAARQAEIDTTIILNKADLPTSAHALARLAAYESLGVGVLATSALDQENTRKLLLPILAARSSILLGQSGMGKSTILNCLVPSAQAATREHSSALGAGKHTTTQTRLYELPGGASLIDSPGFQAFGLLHLNEAEIVAGFAEFAPHIAQCRFYNCKHCKEPGCGVLAALAAGSISPARHALYLRILEENQAARKY